MAGGTRLTEGSAGSKVDGRGGQKPPTSLPGAGGPVRRVSRFLHEHPHLKLGLLLTPPMGWMLVVYLGALALLFATAFWRQDPLTAEIVRDWGTGNFRTLVTQEVYRSITLRTAGIAAAVTLTDIILAIPVAYYAARIARPRTRTIVLLSVVLPLWSSYLARAYSWRLITSGSGVLTWTLGKLGLGAPDLSFSNWAVWLTFSYLWLPFVILPIYAAMDRVPSSLIEASSDLGGRWFTTFRRVVLPIAFPGVVAGSIFSFSLTLGDYITP
ncbi:MAG: putative spermidine/putrescine transport system permease protein, partial [Actinomycetota bacterium]|nr:putative spermidine/putrescine transport system permease protein [Actinomycetota bacterium]